MIFYCCVFLCREKKLFAIQQINQTIVSVDYLIHIAYSYFINELQRYMKYFNYTQTDKNSSQNLKKRNCIFR